MKTAQHIINKLINQNIFSIKISSLRQDVWYLGITSLSQKKNFIQNILQFTCFKLTYYTCSYVKYVWDVSTQQTLWFSIFKISDICCIPPFWTVLVSWYLHDATSAPTYTINDLAMDINNVNCMTKAIVEWHLQWQYLYNMCSFIVRWYINHVVPIYLLTYHVIYMCLPVVNYTVNSFRFHGKVNCFKNIYKNYI